MLPEISAVFPSFAASSRVFALCNHHRRLIKIIAIPYVLHLTGFHTTYHLLRLFCSYEESLTAASVLFLISYYFILVSLSLVLINLSRELINTVGI